MLAVATTFVPTVFTRQTSSVVSEFAAPEPGQPVEFEADLLLRMADVGGTPLSWRSTLYEAAFDAASAAEVRAPRRMNDARPTVELNSLLRVERLTLDALSLRARAIAGLIETSPLRAMNLLRRQPRIDVPESTCGGPAADFAPQYTMFLDTLEFFWPDGTPNPHYVGEALILLTVFQGLVAGVSSSGELVDSINAIVASPVPEKEKDRLMGIWSDRLRSIREDRETSGPYLAPLWSAVKRVSDSADRRRSPVSGDLLRGYRDYLMMHLAAERCGGDSSAFSFPLAMHVARDLNIRLQHHSLRMVGY